MLADLTGPGGTIPNALFGADDAAAAILPNGHVYLTADPGPNPVRSGRKDESRIGLGESAHYRRAAAHLERCSG